MCGTFKTVAIMKKLMNIFVLVAAAAMTLASCQKNEIDGPAKQEVHFTIKAGIAETKTIITDNGDKTYTPSWTKGDKIGVAFGTPGKNTEFENTSESAEIATFEGTYTFESNETSPDVSGTMFAFYPSSAYDKAYDDGDICLDLSETQKPTSTSFDPACDLLIAIPCEYSAQATGAEVSVTIDDMYFARMMSVLRINLNSDFLVNETVKSLSFKAEGVSLTGAMRFDLKIGEFVGNQSTSDKSTVTAVYSDDPISVAGEKNSAYLVVAPVTVPTGTTLTFTIETENYDIVKTISAPADMVMPAGNVAVINLTIAEENCTAKVEDTSDYSGTYAILAKRSSGGYWYMTNDLGTASTKRFTAEAAGDALPEEGVELGASKLWEISKSGDYYTVKSVGASQYITWTSGNSANLDDEGVQFTITQTDGLYNLKYAASDADRYLSLNGNSGNDYFALYKSGQAMNLALIPAVQGEEPSTLTVTVPEPMSAEGGNGSFSYTLTNPKDGLELTASEDADWITDVSVAEGTVSYQVAANETEEAREAVITLTYGDLTDDVTVSQSGKVSESGTVWVATAFTDLKAGDQVVIVGTKSSKTYAMSNDKGTSDPPIPVDVTISGNMLAATPADNIIWYVGVDGTNRIFNVDESGSKWLYCTATNNGVRVGTNTAKTFAFEDNYLKHVGTSRYLGIYNTQDWRCYTAYTTANIANQSFQFFVKSGDSSGETPVDPVQLTMSDITCSAQTENSLTFTWAAVANASKYEVTFNNGTAEEVTTISYTATGLTASTSYTISVKAVGDGTNYTTSEAKTQTGTTEAVQGGGDDNQTTEPVTITTTIADYADANSWTDATKYSTINLDNVITATATSTGSNTGKYYTNGENWRIYQNESPSLTISADEGYTILTVKITYSVSNTGVLTLNSSNIISGTSVDINADSVKFGVGNTGTSTNGQVRVTAIEVVYQAN